MSESILPRPARLAGRVLIVALGGIALLVVLSLAWVGIRGLIAADNLRDAETQARLVADQINDPAAAAKTVEAVAAHTGAAAELTSDPVWRSFERTPWIGPQLQAVSTLAGSADAIAGALTPLIDVSSTMTPDSMRPQQGRIELTGFLSARDAAASAAHDIGPAVDAVESIPLAPLLAPLRQIVVDAQGTLSGVSTATDSLANAATLLPRMLGADGQRNYLVLFQNNAEWRSLGGIAGSAALVRTDGGTMQLVDQDFAANFPPVSGGVTPLEPEVAAIYGTRPAEWFHNVTQVPDFAVSGALARDMWERQHGVAVDGVISIDPVALGYLLQATGPVELPDGTTLNSDNAASLLLNEAYVRFDEPKAQNAFFDEVTRAVFGALTDGRADPATLVKALSRAGAEHRLLLWSAHSDDQQVLAGTTLAGGLPVTDERVSTFGVFVNDGTGSKMDFYQSLDTSIEWTACSYSTGGQVVGTARLTTTITNNAPGDPLPAYITGGGAYGVRPGSADTVGYLYLPTGASLQNATFSGPNSDNSGFGGGMHDGRQVLSFETVLAPGESATATIDVHFDRPTGEKLEALQTPTVNGNVTTPLVGCL